MRGKLELLLRSLENIRSLQLECARMLHLTLLVPVLLFGMKGEGEA